MPRPIETPDFTVPEEEKTKAENIRFVLVGDERFAPRYFPETFRVRKPWKLDRQEAFCEGEDVEQTTSKNRNVHVSGRLVGQAELQDYERIGDNGGPFTMSSITWSGEVVVEETEVEGPVGIDVESGEFMWTYTLDLVSTGRDEDGVPTGIIDRGDAVESDTGGTGQQFES